MTPPDDWSLWIRRMLSDGEQFADSTSIAAVSSSTIQRLLSTVVIASVVSSDKVCRMLQLDAAARSCLKSGCLTML
ncbi:hypothetical protein E2C01_000508 [Portunus trituberculatus]|uniref:Uncharacterized protein n=1 Tax=Portunus trituberculatus TaxID=210409 RepID=A0A5B7CEI5_PORTR|nr:hypothetical protein [Portunus trituberculatus]